MISPQSTESTQTMVSTFMSSNVMESTVMVTTNTFDTTSIPSDKLYTTTPTSPSIARSFTPTLPISSALSTGEIRTTRTMSLRVQNSSVSTQSYSMVAQETHSQLFSSTSPISPSIIVTDKKNSEVSEPRSTSPSFIDVYRTGI